MVQVTITYTTDVTNTGVPNDIIVGCSLLDPNTGEELVMLPWWAIFNVNTGTGIRNVGIIAGGDIPARTYLAKTRAWANRSGGVKVNDISYEGQIIGAIYQSGTGALTGILDEATQNLVISEGAISARIDSFLITI